MYCPYQKKNHNINRIHTYWVGGERPALPQNTHCWMKTTVLDLLIPSPGGWRRESQNTQITNMQTLKN